MSKQIISGICYSKFDARTGPVAVAWHPTDLSMDIRNLVSMKSINILVGEQGLVPKSLAIFPFPSVNLKGLIKSLEIPDIAARGGAIDSSITVLFNEANDPIFYKYINNFENAFNEIAKNLIELETADAEKQQIITAIESFNSDLERIINELRDAELSFTEAEAFPAEQKTEELLDIHKYKLIICGDPAVGKTSTVLRFTERAFKRSYLPTIGTNISEKRIQIGDKQIEFVLWDIAGQSKFQMMRKHFYAGADGQLLIFDLTRPKTLENIRNWYQDIKSYIRNDLPGFILGNKSDLTDLRKVNEAEIENLTNELGLDYIETSALSGKNVDDTFRKLGALLLSSKAYD